MSCSTNLSVELLHQLCLDLRFPYPLYNTIGKTPFEHFILSCHLLHFETIGVARTAKLAKREAAHKMHQRMIGINPGCCENGLVANPLAALQAMCSAKNWPRPMYDMVQQTGLQHDVLFTMACSIAQFQEMGTNTSKRLAKYQAAEKMIKFMQDLKRYKIVFVAESDTIEKAPMIVPAESRKRRATTDLDRDDDLALLCGMSCCSLKNSAEEEPVLDQTSVPAILAALDLVRACEDGQDQLVSAMSSCSVDAAAFDGQCQREEENPVPVSAGIKVRARPASTEPRRQSKRVKGNNGRRQRSISSHR